MKNYQLISSPENETAVQVKDTETTVTYQFAGVLKIKSSPKYLNFGRQRINNSFIKVEKATYDLPLVILDNRETVQPWKLMATLKQPLTLENSDATLPNVLKYKLNSSSTVTLKQDVAQELTSRTNSGKGEYKLSEEWKAGDSGFQIEIPAKQVIEPGKYRASPMDYC